MSFVDFMILGAAKCGTTTLAETLANHPQVCFSQPKEPMFFSKNSDWESNIDSYKKLYLFKPNQICGEASTTYTCYPEYGEVWKSLYKFNPKLKFIYIMRNPIDRVVSHYIHDYTRGHTSLSLYEAFTSNPTYINRTRYFVQIQPYIKQFGENQFLLLTLEDYIHDRTSVLNQIADFLSIERSLFPVTDIHQNKSLGEFRLKTELGISSIDNMTKILKNLLPEGTKDLLRRIFVRKIESRPSLNLEMQNIIWNLLRLDVLEIENLMGRCLVDWHTSRLSNERLY